LNSRNKNIVSAFEHNLRAKREEIHNVSQLVNQVKKECEAKTLKLTHLKYERDNFVSQLQIENIKKME